MRIPLRSTARNGGFDRSASDVTHAESDSAWAGTSTAAALCHRLLEQTGRASRLRLVRGRLAAELLARRGWSALGFVRLSDYSRERHGLSGRTLEDDARVARSLERLPKTTGEFLESKLSWTQVRLLTVVATPNNEHLWIRIAKECDTRTLESRIGKKRGAAQTAEASNSAEDAEENPVRFSVRISRDGSRLWRAACEFAERSAGSALTQAQVLELVVAEAASGAPRSPDVDQDPLHAAFPAEPLSVNGAPPAEPLAGGGEPGGRPRSDRDRPSRAAAAPLRPRFIQPARDPDLRRFLEDIARSENLSKPFLPERGPELAGSVQAMFDRFEARSPFALDARLREVKLAMQRIDADLGRLLLQAVERRVHHEFGFRKFADFVEARLDLCARKAWTLIAIERATLRACPELVAAYREGRVSHLAASALLPVINLSHGSASCDGFASSHGSAWVERAALVTLRRLEAEVAWALDRRDAAQGAGAFAAPAPPPLDHDLRSDSPPIFDRGQLQTRAWGVPPGFAPPGVQRRAGDEAASAAAGGVQMRADDETARAAAGGVQMRAGDEAAPGTAGGVQMRAEAEAEQAAANIPLNRDLHFLVPAAVAGLAEATMLALRRGSESRGSAFERMIATVLLEWTSAPAHPDPVFARDGWRCAVPACRSRRNLHDHHILFRSRGGANDRDNRVSVCAAHHLHGLHAGTIRARGRAPSHIVWELGCQSALRGPLARLLGDRYLMQT